MIEMIGAEQLRHVPPIHAANKLSPSQNLADESFGGR